MSFAVKHTNYEQRDRQKSAVITVLAALLGFLLIYFYTFTKITEKPEEVTTMLLNFGDNRNGRDTEDPAAQQGSLAAQQTPTQSEPVPQDVAQSQQQVAAEAQKPLLAERILTGNNTKVSASKTEKVTKPVAKSTSKTSVTKPSTVKSTSSKATVANSKTGSGDGKGTAAIGNLIGGRKSKSGTQGTTGTTGNDGDPLGGDGNGDSKIGVDRNLIGFIPGTMGRGGAQPSHNCGASGTITISYTVDKAGNVTFARRSGGISDACAVSASISWVKRYVKAERANTASTGTYSITF